MITKLVKAVLDKHGQFVLCIDVEDKIGIRKYNDPVFKYWSFGLINCLIRLLAEDKLKIKKGK